ncbi:hypothetical protein [Geobacter sp. FeAm09]|uniref:hypothetical protein n=1 Tax=Geobacter sp. FeAm09 TaxID=2597769 RepID=UPI001F0D010F|nr:hypothetical protein [Geobacter sp. FeAm09]
MGKTDFRDSRNVYPAYEYLRLSVADTDKDGGRTSLHVGGWLRGDLGDKSARDRYADADVQYGYLSYQGARNNFQINAGRQFVAEGVATERLDGLYLRNDFAAGFSAAAFIGSPVVTEPSFKADDLLFGGRIVHSMPAYYSVGVSALKSFADSSRYREEEGIDLWLHPVKQLDITGRSSYNSLTNGWMEHAYAISCVPLDNLRLYGNLGNINYKDYFYRVTTSALSFTNRLIDPNEQVMTLGGGLAYTPVKNFTIAADYKHHNYEIAQGADYYGGKLSYSRPRSLAAGFSVYRMDGKVDKLKYWEYRVFASKTLGKTDLALDVIDLNYDSTLSMNNVRNALTVAVAASHEINESLKVGADIDYSRNPDFDNEVKGLVKLTYVFDSKRVAEGRAKSEK